MELPIVKHQDLLPKELLERFGPSLQERMGAKGYENRLKIEDEINPATGITIRRLLVIWIHRFFKTILWLLLGILGKRSRAIQTVGTLNSSTIPFAYLKGLPHNPSASFT